jgi:hypothetical protein
MRNYKSISPTTDGNVIGIKTAMTGENCKDTNIKYYNVDDIVHMLESKAYNSLYEVYGKGELKNEQYVKVFFDVDKSKYIYERRWGDLPLWGEVIYYIFGKDTMLIDKNIKYFHGSHNAQVN